MWCSVGDQDQQPPDVIVPESSSRALSAVDPTTQKNELLKLGVEAGGATLLVAALGAFAPELLPEALPELSELATSAPEFFEAITTRLQQSRLGQLATRLGRWRVPVEGEPLSINQARLARIMAGEEPAPLDAIRDPETGQFFEDVEEDRGAYMEAMNEIQRVRDEIARVSQEVEEEAFFDAELIESQAETITQRAREVVSDTVQRIDDAGYGLYRYFFGRMP